MTTKEKIFFISDAHLGEHDAEVEKKKEERLCTFFRHIAPVAAELYVVGDLFDFWFEYRQAVPARHHRVLHHLAELAQGGTVVTYVAGNHDFWLGDFFAREMGVSTSRQPLAVQHQGLKLYIAHGDGLAKKDKGYRLLKKFLRHPLNICLYRLIHPDVGIPLAKLASASSRAYTDRKALELVTQYEQAAKEILSQDFDAVILGHSHYPIVRHFEDKTYVNIGDWITHFTYGLLQEGHLSLEVWDPGSGSLNAAAPACRA